MKSTLFTLAITLLSFNICMAQNMDADSAAKANAILKIEQKLVDGLPLGDSLSWKKYLSPDFFIVNEDGSRDNKASVLATIHPFPAGFSGHINITKPHFTFRNNIAVLNYVTDEYETVYYDQPLHTTYAYMAVYEFRGGQWYVNNVEIFEIPQLPKSVAVDEATLKNYAGTYVINKDVIYVVSVEDGKLYGQRKGRAKEELFAETNSVFFKTADTRGRKIFMKDANGQWSLHDRRNGQDVVWKKQ